MNCVFSSAKTKKKFNLALRPTKRDVRENKEKYNDGGVMKALLRGVLLVRREKMDHRQSHTHTLTHTHT